MKALVERVGPGTRVTFPNTGAGETVLAQPIEVHARLPIRGRRAVHAPGVELVRLAEEYPQPSPRTILIVGIGAGLSIGCRVLGGLALIYATIGFLPLVDACLPILAHEHGFAEEEGIALSFQRDVSWATVLE